MTCTQHYNSPLGEMLLAADDAGLTGLWFVGQKYFTDGLGEKLAGTASSSATQETPNATSQTTAILAKAVRWLDTYFAGKEPNFTPPLNPSGTPFQQEVWQLLLDIPYGQTTTYGELARQLAEQRNISRMSAQAVGSAVGHNHISLIIPCHRVLGTDGSLTGYAGGIEKKKALLKLEGTHLS